MYDQVTNETGEYLGKLWLPRLVRLHLGLQTNPRIEAHFGTIKSQPVYPGYFVDVPEAVTYCTGFYAWYNDLHRLTTLDVFTPNQVHSRQAVSLLAARQTIRPRSSPIAVTRAMPHLYWRN